MDETVFMVVMGGVLVAAGVGSVQLAVGWRRVGRWLRRGWRDMVAMLLLLLWRG